MAYATVQFDLSDIETVSLIEELEDRGYAVSKLGEASIYTQLAEAARVGDARLRQLVGDLVYQQTGRIL